MSPITRALIAGAITLCAGSILSVLAVRMRWMPRFPWPAAIVTPLAIGLFVYWTASTG